MPIIKDPDATSLTPPQGAQGSLGYTIAENASVATVAERLGVILSNIIGILTVIAGGAFVFYFVLGAVGWATAGGDTSQAQNARNKVINAIIGIILTAIAYPAVYVIGKLLGVPFTEPAELFNKLF